MSETGVGHFDTGAQVHEAEGGQDAKGQGEGWMADRGQAGGLADPGQGDDGGDEDGDPHLWLHEVESFGEAQTVDTEETGQKCGEKVEIGAREDGHADQDAGDQEGARQNRIRVRALDIVELVWRSLQAAEE